MRRWIFAATVSFLLMAFTECNVGQFATSLQQCGTQSVVLPFAENPCDHALEALGLPAGWEWSDHFELLDPPEGIVIRGTLTARRIAALPGTAPLEEPVRYRYYRREDAPGSRWIPFEGTLLIRVLPYSVVATAVPERINVGDFSQLHAAVDGGTPPYTFTWIPPFWLSATDVSDPVASPPESVQYTVFVADSEGHLASDSVFVRVNIGAIATADPSVIEPGGLSQLTVEAEGGLRPYTFSWEPAAGLSATNIPNPIAAPGETTTYTVTVTDFNGDAASDSVTVEVAGIVPTEVTLTVAVEGTGAGKVTDVATGGEEIDCTTAGGDCEQSYPLNTPVALLAEPAPSSSFAGWTGCDDVDGHACLVTMSSDRTVTASFATEQDPPPPDLTLTVQVEGEGDGTVTALVGGETIDCSRAGGDCTADYPPGTVVTLEAIPDDRSAFAGWRSNGYDLAITRMEAMPNPAAVGEHLNFEIEVTNFGPDPAEGVVLVTLATGISPGTTNVTGAPPNVTLVSAPAECAQPDGQGNPLVCDLGEVLVGEAVVVSVIVAPNSATLPSGLGLSPLTNEAMVMGDGPDLNLSNNTCPTTPPPYRCTCYRRPVMT